MVKRDRRRGELEKERESVKKEEDEKLEVQKQGTAEQ
jgi:hypothetical protein